MIFSHTQISQYLRCPRSYRYRYLDGWREKETRAAMAFGRCFERALAAYFSQEDCAAALFKEWGAFRDTPFEYKKGESWDRLVHQGVHLLERFAQDDRVQIPRPEQDLQVKMSRGLPGWQRIRRLYRRSRGTRRHPVSDRLENDDEPLPGRAGGARVARPADDLLFLDQRNSGCCAGRLHSKKRS